MVVGFFFGAFLVLLGHPGCCGDASTDSVGSTRRNIGLRMSMFLKPLRKIPFSTIISLISGGVVAYFLIKLNLKVTW